MQMKQTITALAFLVLTGSLLAKEPAKRSSTGPSIADTARVIIRIERMEGHLGRFVDTIDVSLQSTGQLAAGFDFKIAVANPYLTILDVIPGEIYDSCGWDYFSSRPLDRSTKPGYPPVMWQAVGMAEGISNQEPARCFGLDHQASLVRLIVSNEHVLHVVDTTVAIYFLWEDCTDNVVSSSTGEKLYISTNVLDYYPLPEWGDPSAFPTRRGAPRTCQKPGSLNPAQRRVEFHNGGVKLSIPTELLPPKEQNVPDSVLQGQDSTLGEMPD